jgi:signal peptide peptidase SppA
MFEPLTNVPLFPAMEQYLGVWAIEPMAFGTLMEMVRHRDMSAHMQNATVTTTPKSSKVDSFARIEIRGTMTKSGSSLSEAGSTVNIRREIRNAAADQSITGIFLVFDTPGGTASGTAELASDIAAAASVKPVIAFIEDNCCSAGYWAASQCTAIYANTKSAWVGSVGTFMGLYDMSKAAEMAGIGAVAIATGTLKGTGFPGSPITPDQRVMLQGLADAIQRDFTAAVKKRGMSAEQLTEILTAKVYPASEAVEMKLIDGVKTEQQAFAELRKLSSRNGKATAMSEQNAGQQPQPSVPNPATLAELESACQGASADFMLGQLKAGATIQKATAAYCDCLRLEVKALTEKLDATTKALEESKAQCETLKAGTGKHPAATEKPAATADIAAGSAKAQWDEAIAAERKAGKDNAAAIRAVNKANPGLREQMLAEVNSKV